MDYDLKNAVHYVRLIYQQSILLIHFTFKGQLTNQIVQSVNKKLERMTTWAPLAAKLL